MKVACLTDLPNGMPDYLFRNSVKNIADKLDLYVSSQTCGYRKLNPGGVLYISEQFFTELSEILFVGDEDKDKRTAENAGCGFMHIEELKILSGRR